MNHAFADSCDCVFAAGDRNSFFQHDCPPLHRWRSTKGKEEKEATRAETQKRQETDFTASRSQSVNGFHYPVRARDQGDEGTETETQCQMG